MANRGMWGFDDSVAEASQIVAGAPTLGSTANARGGVGVAMVVTSADGVECLLTTGSTSVVAGVATRIPATYATTASWLKLEEGAVVHLSLRFDASGHIVLYRGDGTTVLATSTFVVPAVNVWFYVELKATIADSGGTAEVKVNGTSILTFSGDTRNAGTAGTIDRVRVGASSTGSASQHFDDMYVNDLTGTANNDYLGDIQVRTLLPSGNGDNSGWVGSDGNSVDNYQLVDEVNSTMTDYVGASASGTTDLYQMSDVPSGVDVLAIQELVYALKSDAGAPPTVTPFAKGASGGTRADTALPALSVTAQALATDIRTTDPDGNALTAARVNAMQVGVKIP